MTNFHPQPKNDSQSPITEIYVVGPSSTGKTTLCRTLAAELGLEGPEFITEVAREVMQQEGYTRDDVGKLQMQVAIMKAQLLCEEEGRKAAEKAGHVLLSDRSAVDAVVYALLNSANEEEAEERMQSLIESDQFQLALSAYRRSLFVLLTPMAEWLVDDGVRSMENQVLCYNVFKRVLNKLEIKHREMGPEIKDSGERATVVMNLARPETRWTSAHQSISESRVR